VSLEKVFENALERCTLMEEQPTHVQLNLYGLFKQARHGDVQGGRPGMLNVRGRAKFDAWASRKGMTTNAAMQEYIDVADDLGA